MLILGLFYFSDFIEYTRLLVPLSKEEEEGEKGCHLAFLP